ncbi:MAG: tetratricopeptide repeat protein [Chloroflexota bacterium]
MMTVRIRWYLILILSVVALLVPAIYAFAQEEDDTEALTNAAAVAYASGDFEQAATQYQALIDSGWRSAALYYNLGVAYFEAGDYGRALIALRRAQQFAPRDDAINSTISRIRGARADFQRDPVNPVDLLATTTYSTLRFTELAWLALFSWGTWFTLIIVWQVTRRRLIIPVIAMGLLSVTVTTLFLSRAYADHVRPPAVVTVLRATVYSGPNEEYLEIDTLYMAAELRVVDTVPGWARFELPDGRQGWLIDDAITRVFKD